MFIIELFAFISGAIISIYSFKGFTKIKRWKQKVLAVSLVVSWITGISIAWVENSKSTQAEKDTVYLKRDDDSIKRDLRKVLAILKKNKLHVDLVEDTVFPMAGFYKMHPDLELKGKLEILQSEQRAIADEKTAAENRQKAIENQKKEDHRKAKLSEYQTKFNTYQGTYINDSLYRSTYKPQEGMYKDMSRHIRDDKKYMQQYRDSVKKYRE